MHIRATETVKKRRTKDNVAALIDPNFTNGNTSIPSTSRRPCACCDHVVPVGGRIRWSKKSCPLSGSASSLVYTARCACRVDSKTTRKFKMCVRQCDGLPKTDLRPLPGGRRAE